MKLAPIAVAGVMLLGGIAARETRADNAMDYRLLSEDEAYGLPRHDGSLGIDVTRAQRIADAGMIFDIMQVTKVRPGSAGARAGFREGDQIIAINGRVFPSLNAFATYIRSLERGQVAAIDYMPAGSGPGQAQRLAVTIGGTPGAAQRRTEEPQKSGGLSTGTKLAIGAGAVALLGCYEFGCFSHHPAQPQTR